MIRSAGFGSSAELAYDKVERVAWKSSTEAGPLSIKTFWASSTTYTEVTAPKSVTDRLSWSSSRALIIVMFTLSCRNRPLSGSLIVRFSAMRTGRSRSVNSNGAEEVVMTGGLSFTKTMFITTL